MRPRARLNHAAAGLLGSLLSRNNDVDGYWAFGLLYRDAIATSQTMEINLLNGVTQPASRHANQMAANYLPSLRKALEKQKFRWEELSVATIKLSFNAPVPDPNFHFPCSGDPFICAVTLHTVQGYAGTVSARGRCYPYENMRFMQRG